MRNWWGFEINKHVSIIIRKTTMEEPIQEAQPAIGEYKGRLIISASDY